MTQKQEKNEKCVRWAWNPGTGVNMSVAQPCQLGRACWWCLLDHDSRPTSPCQPATSLSSSPRVMRSHDHRYADCSLRPGTAPVPVPVRPHIAVLISSCPRRSHQARPSSSCTATNNPTYRQTAQTAAIRPSSPMARKNPHDRRASVVKGA